MTKEISITYTPASDNRTNAVLLHYTLHREDEDLTLNCTVVSSYPGTDSWLRMRKFSMRALLQGKRYTALFDFEHADESLDAALFIDKAYKAIMQKEKLAICA